MYPDGVIRIEFAKIFLFIWLFFRLLFYGIAAQNDYYSTEIFN